MRKIIETTLQVEWPGVFENYSRKWVNWQHWRVAATLGSKEDALQECALIFVRCFNHYCWTVDNPAWFMSLFKLALVNDWNTLAAKDGKFRSTEPPEMSERVEPATGLLAARFADASDELQVVLAMIADAPADLLGILFSSNSPTLTNRKLCRFAGIKYRSVDLCGELRALLS